MCSDPEAALKKSIFVNTCTMQFKIHKGNSEICRQHCKQFYYLGITRTHGEIFCLAIRLVEPSASDSEWQENVNGPLNWYRQSFVENW